jgi:hypothetical protein
LDELFVNAAKKEAKIFKAYAPSLNGAPWFGIPYIVGIFSSSFASLLAYGPGKSSH